MSPRDKPSYDHRPKSFTSLAYAAMAKEWALRKCLCGKSGTRMIF